MENNNHKAYNAGGSNPNRHRDDSGAPGAGLAFSDEILANCLADLKRQLELRQAMH